MSKIKALLFDLGDTVIVEVEAPVDIDTTELEIIDGVRAVLEKLKSEYRLAIVSNTYDWGDEDVTKALERYDLARHFDAIVTSVDAGCNKPDEGIFRKAMRLLQVKPHETVMIGDRLDTDISGANLLGITSILIRWNERYPVVVNDDNDLPDFILGSIKELPKLISWLDEQ